MWKCKLGKEAFAYCEALSGVEFKGSDLKVGSDAFYDCLDELTILYKGVKYNKQSIEGAVWFYDVGKQYKDKLWQENG